MLGDLARKPGAWHNSQVRENIHCPLRNYLDEMDKAGLRQVMTQMQELAGRYDFDIALNAVEQMLTRRSQGEEVGASIWQVSCPWGSSTPMMLVWSAMMSC